MHAIAHRVARTHIAAMTREACIIAVGEFGGDRCLLKNRDRNYTPELRLYHEVRNGVETLYVRDEVTGWAEGLNEHGIGIVNAALMVGHDEAEKKLVKTVGKKSKDGDRILKALEQDNLEDAAEVARTHKGGVKGHTLVSDSNASISIEMTSAHDPIIRKLRNGNLYVRTNHGVSHPDAGYTDGEDYISSKTRRDQAIKILKGVERPQDIGPAVYGERKGEGSDPNNMVRDTDNMRTTSQMILDLTTKTMYLYLIPGKVEYLGYKNNLPKGYKPKIRYKVFEYTKLDTNGEFSIDPVRRKQAHEGGLRPLQEPAFNLREVAKHLILLEDHLLHADRRCPDCIWKHLLTAEAFADEADTLDGANPAPPTLAADVRGLGVLLRDGVDMARVGQRARAIRKALVPIIAMGKV
jgi:hypothetical protein